MLQLTHQGTRALQLRSADGALADVRLEWGGSEPHLTVQKQIDLVREQVPVHKSSTWQYAVRMAPVSTRGPEVR